MDAKTLTRTDRIVEDTLSFFQMLLSGRNLPDFAIRLWEGTTWSSSPGKEPKFILVINRPGALRRMFWLPNQLTLGQAYVDRDFDIEGDLVEAFDLGDILCDLKLSIVDRIRFGKFLLTLPGGDRQPPPSKGKGALLKGDLHTPTRDAEAVGYHYNVSNDFYRLWLDERMVYSCAYFSTRAETLDQAQERKLNYICRKLRLEPGERLLDIGCGWGGLIIHAARHYGVTARGITVSPPQAELANERIKAAGLSGRCSVEICDYRQVRESRGFHKAVSVGMIEHVGRQKLPEYFSGIWKLLRPEGVFLCHGIAASSSEPPLKGASFIDHYVFPDGDLVPVSETLRVAEENGFELRDLESLREHYALTLRQWVQRLLASRDAACQLTDEATYRVWSLYMAGSAHGFDVGRGNLYQILLSKPQHGRTGLPLMRNDWYS